MIAMISMLVLIVLEGLPPHQLNQALPPHNLKTSAAGAVQLRLHHDCMLPCRQLSCHSLLCLNHVVIRPIGHAFQYGHFRGGITSLLRLSHKLNTVFMLSLVINTSQSGLLRSSVPCTSCIPSLPDWPKVVRLVPVML